MVHVESGNRVKMDNLEETKIRAEEFLHLQETRLESTQVFQGKLLDVRRDRVCLPNGHEAQREYVMHQGAVVVIPVLPSGELILERQFRYPLQRAFLELPAGKIDAGEAIANTAKRELLEETGYSAGQWRHLGQLHPCIGYSNERIEIFIAQALQQESGQQLDHGEFIDLVIMGLDDALAAIREGKITDGKTIAALFWAEKVLMQGW